MPIKCYEMQTVQTYFMQKPRNMRTSTSAQLCILRVQLDRYCPHSTSRPTTL